MMYDIIKHLGERRDGMGQDRQRNTAQWLFENIFQPEPIRPRPQAAETKLPAPLRAARSLDVGNTSGWQSRTALFLKQARLLQNYEDDFVYERPVVHYFPTYQSLSDPELRGYFSWRTKLRRGQTEKTSLSYAFLYIYELLNQIGVDSPQEGYEKLLAFRDVYGSLDEKIGIYLDNWLRDYCIYYGLDPILLKDRDDTRRDCALSILADVENRDPEQLLSALTVLSPSWLGRSRFFKEHREDMGRVLLLTLRGVSRHFAKSCKKTMTEQYFGIYREVPVRFFDTAVFHDRKRDQDREFRASPIRVYRCRKGLWSVYRYSAGERRSEELDALIKGVDAAMRQRYGSPHSVKSDLKAKWLLKLIDQSITQVLEENQAAQAKKVTLDLSRLASIRADADHTREKLAVEEELWEPEPQPEIPREPELPDTPLGKDEYRLLQCLLYGGSLDWIRLDGKMLSVLTDSVNETLYDQFADSVLSPEGELIEDYIDELKEMVQP